MQDIKIPVSILNQIEAIASELKEKLEIKSISIDRLPNKTVISSKKDSVTIYKQSSPIIKSNIR